MSNDDARFFFLLLKQSSQLEDIPELLTTERNYVDQLNQLITVFEKPMLEKGILTQNVSHRFTFIFRAHTHTHNSSWLSNTIPSPKRDELFNFISLLSLHQIEEIEGDLWQCKSTVRIPLRV
jgi:hypothetical protein